jgi:hypothetical protein
VLRRSFRRGITVGLVAGLVLAATKLFGAKRTAPASAAGPVEAWPKLQPVPAAEDRPAAATTALQPDPEAPTAPAKPTAAGAAWIEATDGVCPTTHPVKAKLSSKIFHLPGMMNYDRTNPDRCYRDAGAAEADGLRAAKR